MKKVFLILSLLGVVGVQASFDGKQLAQDRKAIKKITLQDGSMVELSVWQLKSTYNLLFTQLCMGSDGFPLDKNYLRAIVEHAAKGDFTALIKKAEHAKKYLPQGLDSYFEFKKRQATARNNYDLLVECRDSVDMTKSSSDSSFEFVE